MTILYFIAKWSPQNVIKRFLFNNYFLDSLSFIIYIYKCNILVRYSSVHSAQHQVPIMNKLLIDPLINSIYLVSKPIFLEINTITKQQFVIIYQRCVINLQSTFLIVTIQFLWKIDYFIQFVKHIFHVTYQYSSRIES